MDASGNVAAHTGDETEHWCGHRIGKDYFVAGNLLIGEGTVAAMAETFESSAGLDLPARLLAALEAGQAPGRGRRRRQSAALYTVTTERYPCPDPRVDENEDPVAELRRVYEVARGEMLPFIEALPTRWKRQKELGEGIRGTLIPED